VLALPIPWLHVVSDDPPGTAWRLDGRLHIDGEPVTPPGRWTWLTVGRPQLVGELLRDRLTGRSAAVDLRAGSAVRRPALAEPAAVAVGLRHAGHDVPLGVLVEVRQPLLDGFPEGLLAAVDGIALTDREDWTEVAGVWGEGLDPSLLDDADPDASPRSLTFALRDGSRHTAPGPGLPYGRINVVPTAPADLRAGITFPLLRWLPDRWFRELSLGRSHGMMVALTTYAHASGHDLAQGRHIAGTGGILGDGTVTRIGGLPAKARAANRAGADVLLVPALQAHQLAGITFEGTTVVPVSSLDEAIAWLASPVPGADRVEDRGVDEPDGLQADDGDRVAPPTVPERPEGSVG
jgi:hypothetical protein